MALEREVELRSGLGGDGAGTWQTVYESDQAFELTDLEVHPRLPLPGWFRIVVGTGIAGSEEPITGVYLVQGGRFAWVPLPSVKTSRVAARVDTGPPGQVLRLKFKLTGKGLRG